MVIQVAWERKRTTARDRSADRFGRTLPRPSENYGKLVGGLISYRRKLSEIQSEYQANTRLQEHQMRGTNAMLVTYLTMNNGRKAPDRTREHGIALPVHDAYMTR